MTIVSRYVRPGTNFVLTVRPTFPTKAWEGWRRGSRSKHYSGKGSPNQEGEFLEIKHSRDRKLEGPCAGRLCVSMRFREVAFMWKSRTALVAQAYGECYPMATA